MIRLVVRQNGQVKMKLQNCDEHSYSNTSICKSFQKDRLGSLHPEATLNN